MGGVLCLPVSGPIQHALINSTLEPHAGLTATPIGEHAHAIARAEQLIQPVLYLIEGNAEVDLLRHLVRRLDIQGEMGHDAKSTERDHRATKLVWIEISPQLDQVPIGNDQLHGSDGVSQTR
jgi:hypothetical protein